MTLAARRAQGRMPVIPAVSRRSLLAGGAAASIFGGSPAASATETFTFGLTPLFLDNDIELLSMLERYLATRLERPVALVKRARKPKGHDFIIDRRHRQPAVGRHMSVTGG